MVVTGRDGQPVGGLQRGDFSAVRGCYPQTVTSFEELTASRRPSVLAELPLNILTNTPRGKPIDSVTILLFDTLNTPPEDLTRFRDQMLKHVKGPGRLFRSGCGKSIGRGLALFDAWAQYYVAKAGRIGSVWIAFAL